MMSDQCIPSTHRALLWEYQTFSELLRLKDRYKVLVNGNSFYAEIILQCPHGVGHKVDETRFEINVFPPQTGCL